MSTSWVVILGNHLQSRQAAGCKEAFSDPLNGCDWKGLDWVNRLVRRFQRV